MSSGTGLPVSSDGNLLRLTADLESDLEPTLLVMFRWYRYFQGRVVTWVTWVHVESYTLIIVQ